MFEVKIIKDSIGPNNKRITTLTATYPRFIHSEIMTHRDRARNAASSRAIPWEHPPGSTNKTKSMKEMILTNPVVPIRFGSEQKGMQTGGEIDFPEVAEKIWLYARDNAVMAADSLARQGVHKSICNRLTEPFMWITVVMTATEWKNFFRLRCHPDAEIHFQKIAEMMRESIENSQPVFLSNNEWHLPFIQDEEYYEHADSVLLKVSVARCARVSYLTHLGTRSIQADLDLFERLVQGSGFGHLSPHEHVAKALTDPNFRSGPFIGWLQYRKLIPNECADG